MSICVFLYLMCGYMQIKYEMTFHLEFAYNGLIPAGPMLNPSLSGTEYLGTFSRFSISCAAGACCKGGLESYYMGNSTIVGFSGDAPMAFN